MAGLHHGMRRAVAGAGGNGAWQPSNMGNIHHWLDGSDFSTMWEEDTRVTPASEGSVVGSWYDKVTGLYWTQPTIANKPILDTSTKGLTFDGSNDYLGTAKAGLSWATAAGVNYRIFAITTPLTVSTIRYISSIEYNYIGNSLRFNVNKLQAGVGDGVSNNVNIISTATVTLNQQLSELFFDNSNDLLYTIINNGVLTDNVGFSFDQGYHTNDLINCIGAATQNFSTSPLFAFSGDIHEIVITENPTILDRNSLMSYFNTKYGLSL